MIKPFLSLFGIARPDSFVRAIYDAYGNPVLVDAFGRIRVSQPVTVFDSKQLTNGGVVSFTTLTTGSGAIEAWNQARASTRLTVGLTAGRAVRQTRRRFNYQPAKSQLVFITFAGAQGVNGVTKRVGYFDDANGIFLQVTGTSVALVIRSSTTGVALDTPIPQAEWNIDRFLGYDGGPKLDLSKSQIFFLDFEWLGVGVVRMGFVIDGKLIYAHAQAHANRLDVVYMSTPNLPIRYEVESLGASAGASLETICCSVASEGGADPTGLSTAAYGTVTKAVGTTLVPLVQLRLKTGNLGANIVQLQGSVYATSANDDIQWALLFNPTLSAQTGVAWQSAGDASAVERDVGATGTVTGQEHIIQGGFGRSTAYPVPQSALNSALALGALVDGTRDVIALCARALSGTADVIGELEWREL